MMNEKTDFTLNHAAEAYALFMRAVKDENPSVAEDLLNKIMPALLNSPSPVSGVTDDFHNFSVSVIKQFQKYSVALDIVELGLKSLPDSTDLLADAIRYATSCGKKDRANEYYSRLRYIDYPKWTWRAFSFSIDFLVDQYLNGEGIGSCLDEAHALVGSYKKSFPTEEDPWKCEEDIYSKTNNLAKGIEVLKEAINKHDLCPKCWLRYADIMMSQGQYTEAETYLKKLTTNPISTDSVNMAYVYYLDGLCRMTLWQQSPEYEEEEFDPKTVNAIYRRFRKAINHPECRYDIKKKAQSLARTVYDETGFEPNIEGVDV